MTITTTQVTADEALRAVADGKSVQMIWMDDGKPFFSDFTAKIRDAMAIGEAFLIVEVSEEPTSLKALKTVLQEQMDESGLTAEQINELATPEIAEKIADSQQKIADTCENAAEVPETVVTDPDTTPITVEIPNSHKAEKERQRKLDDERIIALRKSGLSEFKIAEAMDSSQNTIHYHIAKLKKEGRL